MYLKALAASAVGIAVLASSAATAQDKKVRLQVGAAFPPSTGLLGPTQQYFVEPIRTISGGSIDAKLFEPGTLVPPSQYLDAVANGSLDSAWTVSGFWTGKTSHLQCSHRCRSDPRPANISPGCATAAESS